MIEQEYKTLCQTAKTMRLGNSEDLRSFLLFCDRVGAEQTSNHIRGCIDADGEPLRNMILYKLSLDYQEQKK